ncbi:MAG TPA: bacterial transcriptional activator domain-containing protein [Gemmatimonadales bacterium]|jgi:tetratricopeptide (TPR) repeat protein|nr:bacterial transcriptional activator domain-containing protein [Gemmatimonadales bacterium]
MRVTIRLTTLVALAFAPAVWAQEEEAHQHGMGRLGQVHFPVSCTAEAQRRFEHAMAVLHSFWWEEGEQAFNAVIQADSTCAMAYWGLAVNAWGNPFVGGPAGAALRRGVEAAERAASHPAPTRREQGFIAASMALYRDASSTSNAVRLQAYADTMARLYRELPRETEVAIYYALALLATAPRTDTSLAQERKAASILAPLFARYPDHPGLAHYTIHATDSPRLASMGLDAARRYARIAPAVPHAQHMPSHIFVRLGLWEETVASNRKAYEAGANYAKTLELAGMTPEELHTLDYAVYGYLQLGQDSAARAAVATGQHLVIAPGKDNLVSAYNRTAMAARILLERGDWRAAAEFPASGAADSGVSVMLRRFTRALGAARSGRPATARVEISALDSLATALAAQHEPYWARVAAIKRDVADAWIRFGLGDTTAALALAREAADGEDVTGKHPVTPAELLPARELQADMLLAAGRYVEAGAAYRATLQREPGRARSLFGLARAAQLAGDRSAARTAYRDLLRLMSRSDGDRPELATAREFVRPGR